MSLHERSRLGESVPGERRQAYRLYPSLPNVDGYGVCALGRSAEGHHQGPDSLPGDTQAEALAASSDVTLRAHILVLEEQRQELLSINEKWAKEFQTMKRYYKEKVTDLKESLQRDQSHAGEEMCGGGEGDEGTRRGERGVGAELLKAEQEARELRAQNSSLSRRWQHQHQEIRRLNKALEEAFQTTEEGGGTEQDVWKHQAETYKEDFLKERKDREKLKDKYLELERKFRKVHSELRVLKPQVTPCECTCSNPAPCPNREAQQDNREQQDQQPLRRYTHKL